MATRGKLQDLDLCFVDVETTGSKFGFNEIVDIGAIRTTHDASIVLGELEQRVRPQFPHRFSDYARELTGYSEALWNDAPEHTRELWLNFAVFASGAVPVCHNPSFERAFLELTAREFDIGSLGLDYHWIGTESLGWPFYRAGLIPKLSLKTLCEFVGVEAEPSPHRAINGARSCLGVYRGLMAGLRGLTSTSSREGSA